MCSYDIRRPQKGRETKDSGSFSLSLVFSTLGGLAFVMLFYNLTQYVGTKTALQEAARKGARCVSPTDPQCVKVVLESSAAEQEWFGYLPSPATEQRFVSLDFFSYSAAATRLNWNLSYNTYDVHTAKPVASFPRSQVPVRNFRATYSPEKVVTTSYGHTYYTPMFQFPAPEERRTTDEASFNAVYPGFRRLAPIKLDIRRGETSGFATEKVSIPAMSIVGNAECRAVGGINCDAAERAGGTAGTDFRKFAYIALKIFAAVRAVNGSNKAVVAWSQGGHTPGLYIDIFDANGNPFYEEGSAGNECLGGKAAEEFGKNFGEHGLRLRGSDKSDFNNSPVCPGTVGEPKGKRNHWNIKVPRGGSFRVRGYMHSNRGDAESYIDVQYFYDEYDQHTERVECSPRAVLTDQAPCISREECNPLNGSAVPDYNWSVLSCGVKDEVTAIPSLSSQTITAAVCDDSWRPMSASADVPKGYRLTGWQVDEAAPFFVPGNLTQCPLASALPPIEVECEKALLFSSSPGDCQSVRSEQLAMEQAVKELNASQPKGGRMFSTAATYAAVSPRDATWEGYWLLPADIEEDGNADVRTQRVGAVFTRFQTSVEAEGDSIANPTGEEVVQTIAATVENPETIEGWERFKAEASKNVQVSDVTRETVFAKNVYPFKEPVPEIYFGQLAIGEGWDFDTDCNIDAYCRDNYTSFESLSQLLRSYAKKELVGLSDVSYVSVGKQYHHTEHYDRETRSGFPSCTPFKTFCGISSRADLGKRTSLGVSEQKPVGCVDGTYVNCFSFPHGLSFKESESATNVDTNLVTQVTLNEFKRIVPFATTAEKCGETPGCAEVGIEEPNDGHVQLTITYQMPLTYPLNTILGRDVLPISYTKAEVLEREAVGR